jgi:hypothetical protein
MRALVATGLLLMVATSCISSTGETIGPRTTSGIVRLTEDSFGLLVYPCERSWTVSEVVLLYVELDPDTLAVVRSEALLRERFPQAVDPADLLISTAVEAPPAAPGAEREVFDADLLERFNRDADYLTDIDPLRFLAVKALAPDGADITGGSTLSSRFDTEIGEVVGSGYGPVPIDDVRCSGEDFPAWNVPMP